MAETAKVMISVPKEFLAELDQIAREEHRTRSELLREAARQYMDARRRPLRPIERPEVREAIAAMDRLAALDKPVPGWTSTEALRRDRNRGQRQS